MREKKKENFDMRCIRIGVEYTIANASVTDLVLPKVPVINITETTNPLTIHILNGDKLTLTRTCDIDVPCLPRGA